MADYRAGLRKSADPRKANTNNMVNFAKATTHEEDLAAAEYFAQQPYQTMLDLHPQPLAAGLRLSLQ